MTTPHMTLESSISDAHEAGGISTPEVATFRYTPLLLGFGVGLSGIAAMLLRHEVAALIALVVTSAFALCGRRSVLANMPLAFLSVLLATIVVWSGAAWSGVALLSSPAVARCLISGMIVASLVAIFIRRQEVAAASVLSRQEYASCLPALALSGYGILSSTLPVPVGSNWFLLSSDSTSHLLLAAAERVAGRLDYSTEAYPRGWHSVLATLMSASGDPLRSPETLIDFIRISSLATWFLYVLFVLVTTLYAQQLAGAVGLSQGTAALVGAGAGATMLTGSFFTFTMGMGFQTTILLALLLMLAAYESTGAASATRAVIITSMTFVAVAHTWQMALAVAAVPWTASLWRLCKLGRGVLRRGAWVIVTGLFTCALATPPVWAVATQLGLKQAAVHGGVGRLPIEWLPIGVASFLILRHQGASRVAYMLSAMAATTVMTGCLVALTVHTRLSSYYPTKMFWHATTFAVPVACVAIGITGPSNFNFQTDQHSRARKLVTVILTGLLVTVALATPVTAITGSLHEDVRDTLAAVTEPDASQAQVTWRVTRDSAGDNLALMLLDFYSLGTRRPRTAAPISHATACARLRNSDAPAVLTSASQQEVSRRFGCANKVRAIHVGP